jgi:hypothetical protein
MLSFTKWVPASLITIVLLTACGENPANTVYQHLENAVELEQPFEQQQDEAIVSIQSRETMINHEKESIEESFQEFKKIEEAVGKIEDFEVVDVLTDLVKVMHDRYNNYQKLYDSYVAAITLDRTLFEMLQDEELIMEDLQNQIDKVNEAYEKLEEYKKEFNKKTDEYNQLKREFYEKAELNVQFE